MVTDKGKMLERLKRHAWKACKRLKRFGGSNPPLSASNCRNSLSYGNFYIIHLITAHIYAQHWALLCFVLLTTYQKQNSFAGNRKILIPNLLLSGKSLDAANLSFWPPLNRLIHLTSSKVPLFLFVASVFLADSRCIRWSDPRKSIEFAIL